MTAPTRDPEHVAVTLARMEGKIDNVGEKVTDLKSEVATHRTQIDHLQTATQRISAEQVAVARSLVEAERARGEVARALKEADALRVAVAKDKVDESNRRWTPVQRSGVVVGILLSLILIYLAFKGLSPATSL